MIEVLKIVTNERGRITHVIAAKGKRYSLAELAEQLDAGEECVAVFGGKTRCPITTMLDASERVVAVVHDPVGKRTMFDLPEHEDTSDDDIDAMFNELRDRTSDDDLGDMTISEGDETQ